jgi:acyl transferase domain-containing protein/aryl carrier-like protein
MNDKTIYEELLRNAIRRIEELESAPPVAAPRSSGPMAIVGTSHDLPVGAAASFWDLLDRGRHAIAEVPDGRWDSAALLSECDSQPGHCYTRKGAFLGDVKTFDPAFFGITPVEAAYIDPQHRLLLEHTWLAMEDAALVGAEVAARTGVFVGLMNQDYALRNTHLDDITHFTATGNGLGLAAGRLAHTFGFQGPVMASDTTCSSSLVALDQAVRSLAAGDCDVGIVGGVNLLLSPYMYVVTCQAQMLSRDGLCKTFDESADGYVRGEGCAVVVLKRLEDAQAAGDRILAVIAASAVNHDGKSSGLSVPNGQAQESVIKAALSKAQLQPSDIDYVEAHGTGTSLGDPIELGALGAVFSQGQRAVPLKVGSVKSNIGHLEAASGMAGLIKVVLSLRHEQLPASLHVKSLNPHVAWDELPLEVVRDKQAWPRQAERVRRAGVSSFGFSGTNAHVIVEEAPLQEVASQPVASPAMPDPSHKLLKITAKSEWALKTLVSSYAQRLEEASSEQDVADICYTSQVGRGEWRYRLSVQAQDARQLVHKLRALAAQSEGEGVLPQGVHTGKAAGLKPLQVHVLFTGQGSQYAQMGRALYDSAAVFRQAVQHCAQVLAEQNLMDEPLLEVLYGERAAELLKDTRYAQPALYTLGYALYEQWQAWGLRAASVQGHSVGEFVAATVAGVFSVEDGLRLVAARGRLMSQLCAKGAMAAVAADSETVDRLVSEYAGKLSVASYNGAQQTVISGHEQEVQRVCEALKALGVRTRMLEVDRAFHSPMMQPMVQAFAEVADQIPYRAANLKLISNVSGEPVAEGQILDSRYWCEHVQAPVRFKESAQWLMTQGGVCVEMGAQAVLSSLGAGQDEQGRCQWVASLRGAAQDGWQGMLDALGQLYAQGLQPKWAALHEGQARRKVALPHHPFQRQVFWFDGHGEQDVYRRVAASVVPEAELPFGQAMQLPMSGESRHLLQLTASCHPELYDHKLDGHVIVPGAFYLALLIHQEQDRLGLSRPQDAWMVEDIQFKNLLRLDGRPMLLQHVGKQAGHEWEQGFYSAQPASAKWQVHMTACLRPRQTDPRDGQMLDARVQAMQAQAPALDDIYGAMHEIGYTLGPSFAWLGRTWVDGMQGLAELRAPAATHHVDRYAIHPGLLDSCFQLAGLVVKHQHDRSTFADHIYIPFGIGRIRLWTTDLTRRACHVHVSVAAAKGAQDKHLEADIRLLDVEGRVLMEVSEFVAVRAPKRAFSAGPSDLLHAPRWIGQALAYTPSDTARDVLVLHPGTAESQALVQAWQAEAGPGTAIRPLAWQPHLHGLDGIEASLSAWLSDGKDRQLDLVNLMCWPQAQAVEDQSGLWDTLGSLHGLNKCLADQGAGADFPARLNYLSVSGASAATDPAWAWQRGLSGSLGFECPAVWPKALQWLGGPLAWSGIAAELAQEDGPADVRIAEAGQREIQCLAPADHRAAGVPGLGVKPDQHWLLVGGTGGVGQAMAGWLCQQGVRRLSILSRAAPSPRQVNDWSALTQASGTQIAHVAADVTDWPAYQAAFERAEREGGQVNGLIFLSTAGEDGSLAASPWASHRQSARVKVEGARHTATLLAGRPDVQVVYASSMAAGLTPPGQSAYAGANLVMEALAAIHGQGGAPVSVLRFGAWADTGMLKRVSEADQRRMAAYGLAPVEGGDLLQAMGSALASGPALTWVARLDWARISASRQRLGFPLLTPVPQENGASADSAAVHGMAVQRGLVGKRIAALQADERLQAIRAYLGQQVAQVLRVADAQSIAPDVGLFDLGLDSLTAMELKRSVEADLGVALSVTTLFNHPSIDQFAAFIVQRYFPVPVEHGKKPGQGDALDGMDASQLAAMLSRKLASAQR